MILKNIEKVFHITNNNWNIDKKLFVDNLFISCEPFIKLNEYALLQHNY